MGVEICTRHFSTSNYVDYSLWNQIDLHDFKICLHETHAYITSKTFFFNVEYYKYFFIQTQYFRYVS